MRKKVLWIALALALMAAPVGAAEPTKDNPLNLGWGGSAPGGVMYYVVGIGGTVISRELPQYNVTQVSTGGSTENAKRLLKGEVDMGIVYGAHVYQSLTLEEGFANGPKGTMLKGVAQVFNAPTYFVTTPDSPIKSMSDLAGKTVALGPPGSGTVFNCANVLKALGLYDKIKVNQMTFADASRAMANKQLDCFCQSSAPAAGVKELAETRGAYVIPLTKEELTKVSDTYPFYFTSTMKEGTYKGVPNVDLPTLAVYWVAHERVPAKAIQDMLELVYQPQILQELVQGNASWAEMEPGVKSYQKLGAEMHPGAEAYYKAKGQWDK